MDETTDKALTTLVETSAKEVLGPFTEVVKDVVGGVLGDRLKAWRQGRPAWQQLNQTDTLERAAKILKDRGVDHPAEEARPEHVAEILEAVAEKSADSIKDLFARLLSAALDPARVGQYRSEFAAIIGKLEPLDAAVLMAAADGQNYQSQRLTFSQRLKVNEDQIQLSYWNLINLQCARNPNAQMEARPIEVHQIALMPLGRELVRVLR